MWHRLKQIQVDCKKVNYVMAGHEIVYRNTVMVMLALIDPDGTAQRKSRRLKRRLYRNKVLYVYTCVIRC